MSHRSLRRTACFITLAFLLTILIILNINSGSIYLTPIEILRILASGGSPDASGQIIWEIRIPRIISAALLGGALSVSGYLLQTFFNNPIAGPFVLGISSGAKLTVALTMIFFLGRGLTVGSIGLVAAAFAGSLISMGFILLISMKVSNMSLLVVCGVMIGYICSAITDFIVTFADDSNIVNLHNWALGSFSGASWTSVKAGALIVLPCLFLSFLLSKPIGAYQLGENYARNMGVNIRLFRVELILLSSMLSACVTAFAVPHLVKNLFRTASPIIIIPASFLGGSCFCLACDLIARCAFAPTELSISSVTAVFGAPVVIWMLLHRKR